MRRARARRQGRLRLLADRALAATAREYIQGFKLGLDYATKGTNTVNGHKIELTHVDDGGDPAKAVTAAKDLIGQGYKIIAGTLVRRRAAVAPLADAEQGALHLRPGRRRRDHRHEQVHVPLGPPDATRTCSPRTRSSAAARQEGRRLRPGHRVRPGQRRGRAAGDRRLGGQKAHRDPRCRSRRRTSRRSPSRPRRSPTCSSSPGPARPPPRCGRRSTSRACSRPSTSRHRSRRAGDVADVRRRRDEDLRSSRTTSTAAPKNKVNDWLVRADAEAQPGPDLFTPDGFVAPDDRPGAARRAATTSTR